jgi:hypothetical protein
MEFVPADGKGNAVKAYGGADPQLHVFLTLTTSWKVSDQLHAPAALPPVYIGQEAAGSAPKPVWTIWGNENC